MKSSGGAFVTPVYGREGRGYLSTCDAHRHGVVFPDMAKARECAEHHNACYHKGRAPRFLAYGFRDFNG
ncbi:hypothetical protein [Sinomonas susongensis]|uniref:hypothetical protein n=1 Tax=Sinomonas susongensis TaxID=1324851 RepID=UPI001108E47B|nr:hypothetical protein [Sinomonas susongensis]